MRGFEVVSAKPKIKKNFESVYSNLNQSIMSPVMNGFVSDGERNSM